VVAIWSTKVQLSTKQVNDTCQKLFDEKEIFEKGQREKRYQRHQQHLVAGYFFAFYVPVLFFYTSAALADVAARKLWTSESLNFACGFPF